MWINIQMLIILVIALTNCASLINGFEINNNPFQGRNLASCASYLTCADWEAASGCTGIKNKCADDPGNAIKMEDFNQTESYVYCNDLPPEGKISLSSSESKKYTLNHLAPASSTNNPVCQWQFSVSGKSAVTLVMKRSQGNYEDLYIYVKRSGSQGYYTSKDFSYCKGKEHKLIISDAEFIMVKTKLLSDSINYSIDVEQEAESGTNNMLLYLLVAIAILLLALCFSICLICCLIRMRRKRKQKNTKGKKKSRGLSQNNEKLIGDTMSNMWHGEFHQMNKKLSKSARKYKDTTCVICQEPFKKKDKIHITNECSHTFHSKCLKQWFENIDPIKKLICPHWNMTISDGSGKPGTQDFSLANMDSMSQLHRTKGEHGMAYEPKDKKDKKEKKDKKDKKDKKPKK